jgi:hypothetical protein
MSISVSYNNSGLSPTPTVSIENRFIDYNSYRHGEMLEINLNGFLTGISSTGSVSQITNIFASQFGNLVVSQTNPSSGIYNWQNVVIDEISFPQNHFYGGTFIQYSIRAHSYNVPSGIVDPINEYSFVQNTDETVNVSHRIGARGIKNVSGAFSNAVNFVKNFTGKQPFQNCLSFFIPSGYGILQSLTEKDDRLNGSYEVTENYKYNTGSNNPFVFLSNINISDVLEDTYLTIDYNATFKGSPVFNNISTLNSGVSSFNVFNDISNNYGINTGLLVVTTSNITRNSGEANYDIKLSFLSGYSLADLTGLFDYTVSLEKDLLLPKESWKIEGDFITHGALSYRQQQVNAFKNSNTGQWRNYLVGLISGSPIFQTYHTPGNYLSTNPPVNMQENTGLATFHISLSIDDGGEPVGLNNPKYTVEVSPSIWQFELMPSSNIEGLYVVQDLQMKTASKMNFNITAESQFPYSALPSLTGLLGSLSNTYVKSGFLNSFSYTSGINDLGGKSSWIGSDNFGSGFDNIKVVGGSNFNWTRSSGYLWGF